MHLQQLDSTKQVNETLKREAKQAHDQRIRLQHDFEQALKNHSQKLEQEARARSGLINDKKDLQAQVQ